MATNTRIYSATYSNVPVYEYNVAPGTHIMRRRADDWINATHILKAAGFDKPARTRILEREVQKGVHEKVQGGYGKYQGTWIPLHDGRGLAERNRVLELLLPIFDYVPGDRSPPPAPKHATAASSKPRAPRQTAAQRRAAAAAQAQAQVAAAAAAAQAAEEAYEANSVAQEYEQTPEDMSVLSEAIYDDDLYGAQYAPSSRKRKREEEQQISIQDRDHQIWADRLLDYFMLVDSEDPLPLPPPPPPSINLDRAIDEKGHSALHWAAAMGDLDVVRDLINRGARIDNLSNNLETPLMRAVMFTNNYDKNTMGRLIRMLQSTVIKSDWFASTLFHHIAATTSSRNKYHSARYYMDTIINALSETWVPDEITKLLNRTDRNGDTAIHIAARHGARKCVRSLLGRNAAVDIMNSKGETAEHMIRDLNARRRAHAGRRDASSSPFAPDRLPLNGELDDTVQFVAPSSVSYHCETANALVTRLAPALMSRVRALATAYESEYDEKSSEVQENENVVKKRTAEIEALKKQNFEAEAHLLNVASELNGEDEEAERLREEEALRQLEQEAASLLEWEQKEMLHSQVSRELSSRPNGNSSRSQRGSNGVPADESIEYRSTLATRLAQAQAERQRLSKDIIRSMSVAGLGERHTDYKRLIHGALGVPEDMTDSMLEEIIGQLEEERTDRMVLGEVA